MEYIRGKGYQKNNKILFDLILFIIALLRVFSLYEELQLGDNSLRISEYEYFSTITTILSRLLLNYIFPDKYIDKGDSKKAKDL